MIMQKNLVERLNELFSNLKNEENFYTFYYGNVEKNILDIANKNCPYGKILIIYSSERLISLCKYLTDNNFNICEKKIERENCDKISCVSELFTMDEDIRLVISLDSCVNAVAQYFATIKGIVCIIICSDNNILNVVNRKILFTDMPKYFFALNCNNYVIIDEKVSLTGKIKSKSYAFVMSQIVSLFDYRIFCVANSKLVDIKWYVRLKSVIEKTFNIINLNLEEQLYLLIENVFVVQFVFYFCEELQYNSSAKCCAFIHTGDFMGSVDEEFFAFTKIIKIYGLLFNEKFFNNLLVPNYTDIYIALNKKLDGFSVDASEIKGGIKKYTENKRELLKTVDYIKREIGKIEKHIRLIINTYIVFGGKYESFDMRGAIYLSGNILNVYNGVSFLRENGFLELIK